MPYIFFFKIKNCLNDDLFISCDDRISENVAYHLHICSGYVTQGSDLWPMGLLFFSSPEHEVLMVSYCGQSMSVVRRAASTIALKTPTPLGQLT